MAKLGVVRYECHYVVDLDDPEMVEAAKFLVTGDVARAVIEDEIIIEELTAEKYLAPDPITPDDIHSLLLEEADSEDEIDWRFMTTNGPFC